VVRQSKRQFTTADIASCAYLVPHNGLLDGGEVLERGEQDMAPLRTADVVDKAPKLLAQSN
jgi:hypothetical protein